MRIKSLPLLSSVIRKNREKRRQEYEKEKEEKKAELLLSTCRWPGIILAALQVLVPLIFTAALREILFFPFYRPGNLIMTVKHVTQLVILG